MRVYSALLFHLCREVGATVWLLQPASFGLADVFLFGQDLSSGNVFSVAIFSHFSCRLWAHQGAKGCHGKISAPPFIWQQEGCTGSCRAAMGSSRIWQQGSPAQPSPFYCQTDALELEEHTHIGHCLSFRPPLSLILPTTYFAYVFHCLFVFSLSATLCSFQ